MPGAAYMAANILGISSRTRSASLSCTGRARAFRIWFGAIRIGIGLITGGEMAVLMVSQTWRHGRGRSTPANAVSLTIKRGPLQVGPRLPKSCFAGMPLRVPVFASLVGGGLDHTFVHVATIFGLRSP